MKINIYYHDTDCGGVVYYANYLKYLEQARTEYFQDRGLPIKELAKQGVMFVVARQEIDYKAPAFYGDTLDIDTRVGDISAAKIEFLCVVNNQAGKVISAARTILVCVTSELRPQAIPEAIKESMRKTVMKGGI